MILEHFLLPIIETNCYVIACSQTRQAALIDPGEWNDQLAHFLFGERLTLRWILLTHGHADHTGGVPQAQAVTGANVAASRMNPAAARKLTDGDTIEVGSLIIKVLEVPGHTADSLAFSVGGVIFSGDALFAGSVGGTSDPQEHATLIASIHRQLFSLGDDMVVYPGHGPATTIRIERLYNPFLATKNS